MRIAEGLGPTGEGTITAMVQVKGRRKDLDRLRIFACLSTFCYHSLQVFDLNPYYHLKSNTPSAAFDIAARLLHAVRMPLFFLIAGMVGYLALQRYSDREFMKQRALRLLPPFVLGIILFTPAIKYFEMLDGRHISWQGIVAFNKAMPDLSVYLRRYFTQPRWFSWSHMWFLLYLFLLGWATLPAMHVIARKQWSTRAPAAAALLVPLVPLICVELFLRPVFPWHIPNLFWDWASMTVYIIMILSGAALMRWSVLEDALQRWLPAVALMMMLGIYLYLGFAEWPLRGIGRALTLWGALCLVIGLGPWLSRGRLYGERYLSDAVLPLYVLHHLPLIVIAYYVKDLPWPIWQRYGVMLLGSFAVALAIYHFAVRPFGAVRLAFGLPRRRRSQAKREEPGEATKPGARQGPVVNKIQRN